MVLWFILTIMTAAAAVFLLALFLRAFDRKQAATVAHRIDGDQGEMASAESGISAADRAPAPVAAGFSFEPINFAAGAITSFIVLGWVGLFALDRSADLPYGAGQARSAEQPGASAVDQLAAAMPAQGLMPAQGVMPTQGLMPPQGTEGQSLNPAQGHLGTVDEMIERLVERLNRNPSDPEGWRMLGWSYFNTERFAQSAAAYRKAIELNPKNAELRSSRGEALVRAADGRVTEEAKAEFEQALRLDAKDPRGRFYAGLAKEQVGNKLAALDDWVAILNDTDSNEAWVTDLMQRVTELGRETGTDVAARLHRPKPAASGGLLGMLRQQETAPQAASPQAAAPMGMSGGSMSGGPSPEDVRNAEAMTSASRMAMIQGMVDRLASRLDQSPRDVEGWIKLMRSRKVLGETEAAERTFRSALDVFKDAPPEQEQISSAARELGLVK
jgi:cytochrome c-type biogenesis protein CcmH